MSSARLQSVVGGCRRDTFRFDEVLYSDAKLAVTPSVLIVRQNNGWKSWVRWLLWGSPLGEEEHIVQSMRDITVYPDVQRCARDGYSIINKKKWIWRLKKKKTVEFNISIEMHPAPDYDINNNNNNSSNYDRWSWSSGNNKWPSSLSSSSQCRNEHTLRVLAERPEEAALAIEKAKLIFY